MSTFSFNKSANDGKSNTLGSMNRQNVIQETNKKRTLLKDSSWIKFKPEEEDEKIWDENLGKSVLNRYKSQEHLDSSLEEKKPIHNRFKSDDALDRLPSRNTFEGRNKAATLERLPMSEPETTNKRQSWAPSNKTTTTTTTTTEESKRKSWAPTSKNTTTTTTTTTETKQVVSGKPDGQKITISSSDNKSPDKQSRTGFVDSFRSRFEKTEEKPSPPTSPRLQNIEEKPRLPPKSPVAKTDDRPSYPSKPVIPEMGERRSAIDRKQRSQDIDTLIEVSTSKSASTKSTQDLGNLIDIKPTTEKGTKSTQDLSNLIEIKPTTDKAKKSTQDLGNLIDIKPTTDKAKKSTQDLDNLIDIKPTTDKAKKRDQLDDFIEISSTAKNVQKKDNLDNFIEIKKPEVKTRDNLDNLIDIKKPEVKPSVDNLIDIKTTTNTNVNKGSQNLEDLIAISGDGNKGPAKSTTNITNRSSTTTTTYNVKEQTSDIPNSRSSTTSKVTEYQDGPGRRTTTSSTYKVTDGSYDAPTRRSTTSYKDTTDGPSSGSNVTITQETSYSSLPNLSYGDASRKSSSNSYGQNIVSNSIKTVYSTSDRSVMEKDICTYCRKPLGIDAKMILNDLNICCHATCFKCEACSGTLENLKAGDSMWIYKQAIHCEPCYVSAREKWII